MIDTSKEIGFYTDVFGNEITEYEVYEGGLGDKMIDKPYWIDFLRKIRLEIGGQK